MGSTRMSRTFVALLVVAALSLCLASEVEDLGAQPVKQAPTLGEAAKTKARTRAGVGSFHSALMTSGSFTMMASSSFNEEERRRERDELGEANDWDITNGGQCEESEEAWVLTAPATTAWASASSSLRTASAPHSATTRARRWTRPRRVPCAPRSAACPAPTAPSVM